jgi:hypothetical protein
VPHTYYAKAAGSSFSPARLDPLLGQGASAPEVAVTVMGIAALAVVGAVQRRLTPFAVCLACMGFCAAVSTDWMPNLRFLLPVTLFAPLGVAVAIRFDGGRFAHVVGALLAGASAVSSALTDTRLSPVEHEGRRAPWAAPKSAARWEATRAAYRHAWPLEVVGSDGYQLGQVTQVWRIVESSAVPLATSWYVGRDIGAVGYFTGVRVFDTAGLFTPDVVASVPWRAHGEVTRGLVVLAFDRRPVAAELFDGWENAFILAPELAGRFQVSPDATHDVMAHDAPPPSRQELAARYGRMVAKLPRAYDVQALYGEALGAAIDFRAGRF